MTLRRLVPIPLLVAIFAIVVTIAACGGDESPDATTTTTQAVATSTATSIPTVTSTPTVGDPLSLAEAYYSAYKHSGYRKPWHQYLQTRWCYLLSQASVLCLVKSR